MPLPSAEATHQSKKADEVQSRNEHEDKSDHDCDQIPEQASLQETCHEAQHTISHLAGRAESECQMRLMKPWLWIQLQPEQTAAASEHALPTNVYTARDMSPTLTPAI